MQVSIVVLLALLIAVAALFGSPSVLNLEGHRVMLDSRNVTVSMNTLMLSKINYEVEMKTMLPEVEWKKELRSTGNPVPHLKGYEIEFSTTTGEGQYFCIYAENKASSHRAKVLTKVREGYVTEKVFLNDTCGALEDHAPADNVSEYNMLALTLYMDS